MAILTVVSGSGFAITMRQDEFSLLNGRPVSLAAPALNGLPAGSEAVGLFPSNSIFAQLLRDCYSNAQALQPYPFNAMVVDTSSVTVGTNGSTVNFNAPSGAVLTAGINTIFTAANAGDVVRVRFNTSPGVQANTDFHISKLMRRLTRAIELYYPTTSGGAGISLSVQGGAGTTFAGVTIGFANNGTTSATQCTATNCNVLGA